MMATESPWRRRARSTPRMIVPSGSMKVATSHDMLSGSRENVALDVERRHAHELGESAGVKMRLAECLAVAVEAAPAVVADEAGHVMVHEDAVALLEAGHAGADGDDNVRPARGPGRPAPSSACTSP